MKINTLGVVGGLGGLALVAGTFAVGPSAPAAPNPNAASSAKAAPAVKARWDAGTLYVQGNDKANRIEVYAQTNGVIRVVADGQRLRINKTPRQSNTDQIRISSRGGDDIVDLTNELPSAVIYLGDGHDDSSGGTGDDILRGGNGNDFLGGSQGDDVVMGDAGNDNLQGFGGGERLYGNAGNDALVMSSDSAYGGPGNDLYLLTEGPYETVGGTDVLVEKAGEGADTVKFYSYSATPITFSLGSAAKQEWTAGRVLRLNAADTFDRAWGGNGDDVLTGNGLRNHINGGGGDDQLTGAGGVDTFFAGENLGALPPSSDDDPTVKDAGTDTLTDFADGELIRFPSSGKVIAGLGTSTVEFEASWDYGFMTVTSGVLTAEDFG